MKISKKVKVALDETRMLVLGAQILIGFQFRGVFQNLYEQLPPLTRYLNGIALLLMILTVALLILPGPYHRIVEEGNASGRFHQLTSRAACLALAPFSLSLGIDVGIAGERVLGVLGGIAAGTSVTALALFFWYGIEALRMPSTGAAERTMTGNQKDEVERTELYEKIDQMLTEARVILPGAQALLGFQLAIVLTEAFEKLPWLMKLVHGTALLLVAVSIVLLMAPAAYHRIVYAGEDSEEFHCIGSRFVTWSTVPLALGLSADVFVVGTKILPSVWGSTVVALGVFILLFGLWYGLPLLARRHKQPSSSPGRVFAASARSRG
jgi:Family of unknown function (DUF6328)